MLIAGTGTGAAIDLATRRIPNGVVALTAAVGGSTKQTRRLRQTETLPGRL